MAITSIPNQGALGPAFDFVPPPAQPSAQPATSGQDLYVCKKHPDLEPMLFHPNISSIRPLLQTADSHPVSLKDFLATAHTGTWYMTTCTSPDGFVTSSLHQVASAPQLSLGNGSTYPSVSFATTPGSQWKAVTPDGVQYAATKPYENGAFGGPSDVLTWDGNTRISLVDPAVAQQLQEQTGKVINGLIDPLPVSESPYRHVGLGEHLHNAVGDVQSAVGNVTGLAGGIKEAGDWLSGNG